MADMQLTSTLFKDGDTIPSSAAHTFAGGTNVSPDLEWSGAPAGTRAFAITCYDPDAPTTVGFVHWILFDIDPSTTSIPAGCGAPGEKPAGSTCGFSDWGESHYGGMAPPPGDPHRYIFTVYALDQDKLGLDETTTYAKFMFMTRGHVLAKATLTGLFST